MQLSAITHTAAGGMVCRRNDSSVAPMCNASLRAGMSTVTATVPDGRPAVASVRNVRALPERRARRVTRLAAHASKPATSSTAANVVISPATTSCAVGVEYTNRTSNGPIDTCLETGAFTPLCAANNIAAAIATSAPPRIRPGTARTSHDAPAVPTGSSAERGPSSPTHVDRTRRRSPPRSIRRRRPSPSDSATEPI